MIKIEIVGENQLMVKLGVIAEGLEHLPIQEGLKVLAASVRETFEEGGRPEWAPIQAARNGRGPSPLWDTGEMMEAATATRPGIDGSTYELNAVGGQIGVEPLFHGARRHTFGFGVDSLGRSFDEPARAFMILRTEDEVKVVEIFDMYIGALIAGDK